MDQPKPAQKRNIIVVDDEADFRELISEIISQQGFQVFTAPDGNAALEILHSNKIDIALIDFIMPQMDGMELMQKIKKLDNDIDVIFITGHGSIESAVDAMKKGAYDYITKPIQFEELEKVLQRIGQTRNLISENRRLKQYLKQEYQLQNIIGRSSAMKNVCHQIEVSYDNHDPILIEGEIGTGKELIAKTIHFNSNRAGNAFIPHDCATLSEKFLLDEWLGRNAPDNREDRYEKKGIFRLADGGSVYLKNVSVLSPRAQKILLQILTHHQISPIGGGKAIQVDIRLIVSSKVPLEHLVEKKTFRDELFEKLRPNRIVLPSLRERKQDIPILLRHFLKKSGKGKVPAISSEAMKILKNYTWPENVWELENVSRSLLVNTINQPITPDHLPKHILTSTYYSEKTKSNSLRPLDEIEKQAILRILQQCGWNVKSASRMLQITRSTLYRKMNKFGIERP